MTTTSEELAFVTIEGSSVSCSHAVLIETSQGWHLELEGVPADSCPFVERECDVAFDTWEGDHYSGAVTASYATDDAGYVMLTGVGELEHTAAAADVAAPGDH
jgi:hypothetical protein